MKSKNENGEVVVEASLVVTLVVIFISIVFYIGMILYQQSLVSIMANQTASNIAQVYSNNFRDPFTGYVDPDSVYQSVTYSNMKTDAYINVITQKANAFAKYRLKSSRILTTGTASVDVELVKKPNELLKSQVVVTVRDTYDLPLVSMFGVDNSLTFTATGRADCVDLLEYLNGVEAVGNPETSNVTFLPNAKNCTVTFFSDRTNPSVYSTVTVLKGKSILSSNRYTHSTLPTDPTNGSYVFSGWVDEGGNLFTATTEVNENIVVYGTWKCVVTMDADGGTVNSQPTYSIEIDAGNKAVLPNASRDGYNFLGWFTQKNGAGVRYVSNDTRIESSITLYASWECTHEGVTGYTFQSRHGTMCVDHPYDLYKCQRCGATKQVPFEGEHNTAGRCNQKHGVGQNFHCTAVNGWHIPGYGMYHVTCTGCGRVATSAGMVEFDGQVHTYWYWCGLHGSHVPETQTH